MYTWNEFRSFILKIIAVVVPILPSRVWPNKSRAFQTKSLSFWNQAYNNIYLRFVDGIFNDFYRDKRTKKRSYGNFSRFTPGIRAKFVPFQAYTYVRCTRLNPLNNTESYFIFIHIFLKPHPLPEMDKTTRELNFKLKVQNRQKNLF